ncbi:hypothetical protein AGOR_G00216290 [Albula goreensis]|uniref:WW domain-containing protein n=1 Tax=Albula goreensis TaxID=1534307 RepID=A0A8T3CMK4_9TELE|nr:hypothetical protein AGOR_G00216290 [Albula goreensis]
MEKDVLEVRPKDRERIESDTGSAETQSEKAEVAAPSASESESEVWIEGITDDGLTYYYNTRTGDAQWEKPEGFQGESKTSGQTEDKNQSKKSSNCPWMEVLSPDGYAYYYNTETGESSWEKPAEYSALEASIAGDEEEEVGEVPPPKPEPLSGDEDSSTDDGLDDFTESRVSKKRQEENSQSSEEGKEEDDDDDDDEDDDDKDDDDEEDDDKDDDEVDEEDKSSPSEDEDEEDGTPAKKARKADLYAKQERPKTEQDPNTQSTLQTDKEDTGELSRKRKLENGKSGSVQQRRKDDSI